MSLLDGPSSAYTHNGDRVLMESLGLQTYGFKREWTDLGTVVVAEAEEIEAGEPPRKKMRPAATVQVEVIAHPAQFFRFTITRPQERIVDQKNKKWYVIYEPVQRFVIKTGSGGFGDYWPVAKMMAEHMIDVKRVAVNTSKGKDRK